MTPRQKAKSLNLPRFIGNPCKEGHTERFTGDSKCVACERARLRREYKDPVQRKRRDNNSRTFVENNREHIRQYISTWQKENKELVAHYSNKVRAALLQRTPPWADLEAIKTFYLNCPPGYQVDHIIPLQGKYVSGLHVRENLQYLTKSGNCKKKNIYDPERFPEQRIC